MTVAELIEALSAYPPETRVLVEGYEGGFDELRFRDPFWLYDSGPDQWMGRYSESITDDPREFQALVLERTS